jgi:replicative DNA helicase Mcm
MNSEQVNIEERLVKFLSDFKDEKGRIKYRDRILELIAKEQKYLSIDFGDILRFDEELAIAITERPYEALKAARKAVYEILSMERPTEMINIEDIYVGFSGEAGYLIRLREINSRYLNRLISINGLFIRCSQVYSFIEKAVYRCNTCGNEIKIEGNPFSLSIDAPSACYACGGKKRRFSLVSEKTSYTDIQFARIQERPDELPPGQIPRFIDIIIKRPLVEAARPGDIVRVTGILSVKGDQVGRRRYHEFVIYVVSIEALTKEAAEIKITRDEEEELVNLSGDKNFYNNIIKSIAPSIYGLEIEKEALLLSLIGGKEKILPDGVKFRGNIHILLLGDPGTAKSELLKYASALAPKGLYTSGRGTTAAGLTAAVIKETGGGLALEAGAVVLADMGTCAIDEIDKMRPEDRVALHEAMEQQTVSIAKGGIVATLNARTTIIAAANPKEGRYNRNRPPKDNIDLPVTLLSRFDLIYIIKDEPEVDRDTKLVDHVLKTRQVQAAYQEAFPIEFLRKYIAYAKRLDVTMTEDAMNKIKEYYLKMRMRSSEEDPVSISPRQLESLIRLSEAIARAKLKRRVEAEEAERATFLLQRFLSDVGIDIETGKIDIDMIYSGIPMKRRSKTAVVIDAIERLIRRYPDGEYAYRREVIDYIINNTNLSASEAENIIDKLVSEGVLFEPGEGRIAKVSR